MHDIPSEVMIKTDLEKDMFLIPIYCVLSLNVKCIIESLFNHITISKINLPVVYRQL